MAHLGTALGTPASLRLLQAWTQPMASDVKEVLLQRNQHIDTLATAKEVQCENSFVQGLVWFSDIQKERICAQLPGGHYRNGRLGQAGGSIGKSAKLKGKSGRGQQHEVVGAALFSKNAISGLGNEHSYFQIATEFRRQEVHK